jgi:hypothetical protein
MSAQLALSFRRPQRSYWLTTPLSLHQAGAIRLAEQQDEAVVAIFRALQSKLTPSQVHLIGQRNGRQWLLTSVRRSMTNLANEGGPLVRCNETQQGPHGRPEHFWTLAVAQGAAPHRKPDGVTVEAA